VGKLETRSKIKEFKVAEKGAALQVQPAETYNLTQDTAAIEITTQDNKKLKVDNKGFHMEPSQQCYELFAEMAAGIHSVTKEIATLSANDDTAESITELVKLTKLLLQKDIPVQIADSPKGTASVRGAVHGKVFAQLSAAEQVKFTNLSPTTTLPAPGGGGPSP
jgi:hypothetical protein